MPGKSEIPTEIPIQSTSPDGLIAEALKYVKDAADERFVLRVMGGFAVCLHSNDCQEKWRSLGRDFPHDLDFVSRFKYASQILKFFEERKYSPPNQSFLANSGRKRLIFTGGLISTIDVFFDRLEMCHTIDFRRRLELDYPTIPLAELLLQKLQIVRITEKDMKDVIVLLSSHELAENDSDAINVAYISDVLSRDWGFWYTVMINLNKTRELLQKSISLKDEDIHNITNKINKIVERIEKEPKTIAWKMREKVGSHKTWYTEVEEGAGF